MERLEKLKAFLKESPTDSFLNHALALEYLKLNNQAAAEKVFEALLERDPDYVGSYYHLGKLLEAKGEINKAIGWIEKGMASARKAGDRHALIELQAAYDDLVDQ